MDVPSSWDVDLGNTSNAFTPEVLISLSAPKQGVKKFKGTHFIGGRFIPPAVASKFNLGLPRYLGDSQIVNVTGCEEDQTSLDQTSQDESSSDAASTSTLNSKSITGTEAGQNIVERKREEENSLMKRLNLKGEGGMTEKEKEIIQRLTDVTTPTANSDNEY